MTAYILLNLLNSLMKNNARRCQPVVLSFFRIKFNKLNNNSGRIQYSIYHMTLNCHFISYFVVKNNVSAKSKLKVVQDVTPLRYGPCHYENTPMQYTAIFHGCKNDNFQITFFNIFIILLKTYIVGTR